MIEDGLELSDLLLAELRDTAGPNLLRRAVAHQRLEVRVQVLDAGESGVERPAELPRARQQETALPGFRVQQGSQEIIDGAQNLIRVFNATRRLRESNVLPEGEAA